MSGKEKEKELVVTEEEMLKAFEEIEDLAKSNKGKEEGKNKKGKKDKDEKNEEEGEDMEKSETASEGNTEASKTDDAEDASSEDSESEDEEPTDEDAEEASESDDDEDNELDKSFTDEADEDEVIRKSVEVSDFLESLVNQIGESIDPLTKALIKSQANQEQRYADIAKMVGNLSTVVKGLAQELGAIKNSPVRMKKSVTKEVSAPEKTFEPEDTANKDGGKELSKSQVADGMFELMKKGEVDPLEISKFEVTGEIRPAILEKIKKGF